MTDDLKPIEQQSIVEKLRIRAQIRRKVARRPEGQADRIADLCAEAAAEIVRLQNLVSELQRSQPESGRWICAGCGSAAKGSFSTPSLDEIRTNLQQLACWSAAQIEAEMARLQFRLNAGGHIRLCDDCWALGYFWTPGEFDRLHRLAQRRSTMTRADCEKKIAHGKAVFEVARRTGRRIAADRARCYLDLLGEVFAINHHNCEA